MPGPKKSFVYSDSPGLPNGHLFDFPTGCAPVQILSPTLSSKASLRYFAAATLLLNRELAVNSQQIDPLKHPYKDLY